MVADILFWQVSIDHNIDQLGGVCAQVYQRLWLLLLLGFCWSLGDSVVRAHEQHR